MRNNTFFFDISVFYRIFASLVMNTENLISIIVPVYNVGSYLHVCVESVLRQTYNSWELLLVDDESTDGSAQARDDWAGRDERIRVFHNRHAGPAVARNTGMTKARGAFFFFMDSDDWIEPYALACMMQAMGQTDVDIVVSGAFFDYPSRTKVVRHTKTDCLLTRDEALKRIITGRLPSYLWMLLLRRTVVQEPFVDIPCFEDYATAYKWFAHTRRVALMAKPMYHYIQREGSLLHSSRRDVFLLDVYCKRHNYIREHGLMDEAGNRANTVRNLLKLAKDYARKPLETDDRLSFVEEIREAINSYLPVSFLQLGLKRWWRLQLLKCSVQWFVRVV